MMKWEWLLILFLPEQMSCALHHSPSKSRTMRRMSSSALQREEALVKAVIVARVVALRAAGLNASQFNHTFLARHRAYWLSEADYHRHWNGTDRHDHHFKCRFELYEDEVPAFRLPGSSDPADFIFHDCEWGFEACCYLDCCPDISFSVSSWAVVAVAVAVLLSTCAWRLYHSCGRKMGWDCWDDAAAAPSAPGPSSSWAAYPSFFLRLFSSTSNRPHANPSFQPDTPPLSFAPDSSSLRSLTPPPLPTSQPPLITV